MYILLSNDDGYRAPGLRLLAESLQKQHNISVVAPDRDRSGASNSLTLDRPLRAFQVEDNIHYVNGTPTDCVHLAITGLLEHEPDMVISGINAGANMGDDVLYSGTVAAAMEGRFLGYPAIAVSMTSFQPQHFETAIRAIEQITNKLANQPLAEACILNINVPDIPWQDIKGLKITRLGNRHKSEGVIKQLDPRNEPMYWVGPPGKAQDAGEGTDFHATANQYISITPLQIDLTRHSSLAVLEDWVAS